MSASGDTSEAAEAASTMAVAVSSGGGGSRRAVRWAAENLIPHARRAVLLHVIPSVSSIPSPSGKRTPIEQMEKDVVEMYVQDLKSKSQQALIPYMKLCGRRDVETLVLDGENTANALVKYAFESGIQNLVLGSSSFGWFTSTTEIKKPKDDKNFLAGRRIKVNTLIAKNLIKAREGLPTDQEGQLRILFINPERVLKGPDIPSTVLKSAPNSCNIFVVSRRKLTMKLVGQSVMSGVELSIQTKRTLKALNQEEQDCIFKKQMFLRSSADTELLSASAQSDISSFTQSVFNDKASTDTGRRLKSKLIQPYSGHHECQNLDRMTEVQKSKTDVRASIGETPSVILCSPKEGEVPDEAVRLKIELENTIAVYSRTCEDLALAKTKVQQLSAECSNEARKMKDAQEREEDLKQIAVEEKTKYLNAIKEVQEVRGFLGTAALDRHKAETVARKAFSDNLKLLDTLLLNDKRCRTYSRSEIEVATDNFSDSKRIGEGSYGNVYKCKLDQTLVAVKVLRRDTIEKKEEFHREVEILSRLRHPHLVLLLGFCPDSGCLVYEYMENGSLEDKLFYRERSEPLPWYIRVRVIYEVACGLAFLHATKPEPIVHRDLKPGNILLDRNYLSKIGDVGLAKLISDVVPDGLTEYKETILAGTLYYMDPEYQRTGTVRPKSDLYALGIITLQLLTARHPKGLLVHVEKAIRDGSFATLLDESVSDWPPAEAEKLAKIALKCSRLRCRDRPDLESEVLPELQELVSMANLCFKLRQRNVYAPTHYICPILQEIMDDPYVASDGYTYEHRAIKAWLEMHKVSPVTKLDMPNTAIVPNYSLRSAIQEWKSHSAFVAS